MNKKVEWKQIYIYILQLSVSLWYHHNSCGLWKGYMKRLLFNKYTHESNIIIILHLPLRTYDHD